MVGGVVSVIAVYLLVNVALLAVLPVADLARSTLPAADAAQVLVGERGRQIITVLSIISLPPMLNAIMMIGTRILFALGRDGLLWKRTAAVSATGTPVMALLLTTAVAVALIATGTFQRLVAIVSFFLAANYACAAWRSSWSDAASRSVSARFARGATRGRRVSCWPGAAVFLIGSWPATRPTAGRRLDCWRSGFGAGNFTRTYVRCLPAGTRKAWGIFGGICITSPAPSRCPLSAAEAGADEFPRRARGFLAQHFATQHQRALAALDDDDVDDVVVLLGKAVAVAAKQPETVVRIVGQRFAGRVVGTDFATTPRPGASAPPPSTARTPRCPLR